MYEKTGRGNSGKVVHVNRGGFHRTGGSGGYGQNIMNLRLKKGKM